MIGIATIQWNATQRPDAPGNTAIIAFPFLFYTCFNATWGVGSWLYASEIWPIRYRAKGSALSTGALWIGTFCVAQLSPVVAEEIGWGLYVIYAGICVVAFVFVRYVMGEFSLCPCWRMCANVGVVETKDRTLEEMARLFGIDTDVRNRADSDDSELRQVDTSETVHVRKSTKMGGGSAHRDMA